MRIKHDVIGEPYLSLEAEPMPGPLVPLSQEAEYARRHLRPRSAVGVTD